MGAWGTSIFSDDLAMDIRGEYNVLLSVGKTNEEAERLLMKAFSEILNCDDPDEDVFWFALALCEWKKGRLSEAVKKKALDALESGRDAERWNTVGNEKNYEKRKKVLKEFKELILSPMPPLKKIKKPTVHHCPYREGSLLAYRIVSNKDYLQSRACNMKYVLLRVLRIEKHPISRLFDIGYYNENMLVGLYNWIGSEIPDPAIVNSLKYIPIEEKNIAPPPHINESLLKAFPEERQKAIISAITSHFNSGEEKSVWLDWRSSKTAKGEIVFLDLDENFCNNMPEYFKPFPDSRTYTHFLPFDVSLSKKFDAHLKGLCNTDSVII